ncbi:MAG: PilZ domain-containing protein [Desulfobacterales bacterium]|nr:PilZ domain-containing protein [Desulfobacterales bacterium]
MSEKRKHPRIDSFNLLAYVCLDECGDEREHRMGRTLNVSEAGILLETYIPIDPAHVMSLKIGLREETVDIAGKIAHVVEKEPGLYEIGVEFYDVDECAMRTLSKYIHAFGQAERETEPP